MSRTRKDCGIAIISSEIKSGSPGAPFFAADCNSTHEKENTSLKLEHIEFNIHTKSVSVHVSINITQYLKEKILSSEHTHKIILHCEYRFSRTI